MNELLKQFLGALLRHALTGAAGYFVAKGILTPDQSSAMLAALVAAVLGVGWSLWQKYVGRLRLVSALDLPAGTSEARVKNFAGVGGPLTPIAGALLLVAAVSSASCGTRTPPASLSPVGQEAFKADQVVKVVNDVAQGAITANRAPLPIGGWQLSDAQTAIVLRTCDVILAAIQQDRGHYALTARRALRSARDQLSDSDRAKVAVLLDKVSAILDEVLP